MAPVAGAETHIDPRGSLFGKSSAKRPIRLCPEGQVWQRLEEVQVRCLRPATTDTDVLTAVAQVCSRHRRPRLGLSRSVRRLHHRPPQPSCQGSKYRCDSTQRGPHLLVVPVDAQGYPATAVPGNGSRMANLYEAQQRPGAANKNSKYVFKGETWNDGADKASQTNWPRSSEPSPLTAHY